MGIKRVVDVDFWRDDKVAEEYTPEERYFFLYLLTNPNTKQCGIYHLPIRTISYETGYSDDAIRKLLDKFQNNYKNIVYSYDTNEIAILNFLKHSIVKGGKPVEDCLRKELEEVKDRSLIKEVYSHIIEFMNSQIEMKALNNSNSMYIGIKDVFTNILQLGTGVVDLTYQNKKISNINNYTQRSNINFNNYYAN